MEIVTSIDDPRSRHGRRHDLGSLLALLIVGLLCGANTVKGCVVFGRHRRALRRRLGFTHSICPSQSTYTRLFQALPVAALGEALGRWLEALAALRAARCGQGLVASVDGKALRATGQHVLNIFIQDWWHLLDMREVAEKKNELSALNDTLDEMLEKYPFLAVFTFDAMFAQRNVVEKLTRNNRMGIFQIKDNQRETRRRLARWFAALPCNGFQTQSVEKGAIIS